MTHPVHSTFAEACIFFGALLVCVVIVCARLFMREWDRRSDD